jgi:cytochrome P450
MCIGNNFALMEAALIMSTVTQRYRLDLAPDREVKAQPKTTLAPLPGVWMTVHAV